MANTSLITLDCAMNVSTFMCPEFNKGNIEDTIVKNYTGPGEIKSIDSYCVDLGGLFEVRVKMCISIKEGEDHCPLQAPEEQTEAIYNEV